MLPSGDSGQYLAVIGGRFLPVEEMRISSDSSAKTLQTVTGNSIDMVTTADTIDVGVRTRRDPMLWSRKTYDIFFQNREHRIHVKGASVVEEPMEMNGFNSLYSMEFEADEYELYDATASFVRAER